MPQYYNGKELSLSQCDDNTSLWDLKFSILSSRLVHHLARNGISTIAQMDARRGRFRGQGCGKAMARDAEEFLSDWELEKANRRGAA